jgi:hypothetical protein
MLELCVNPDEDELLNHKARTHDDVDDANEDEALSSHDDYSDDEESDGDEYIPLALYPTYIGARIGG